MTNIMDRLGEDIPSEPEKREPISFDTPASIPCTWEPTD